MSETCPKCGAAKELGGGWRCGSWSSLMGFAEQGEHCRDRCTITALAEENAKLKTELVELVDCCLSLILQPGNTGYVQDAIGAMERCRELLSPPQQEANPHE